MDAKVMLDAAVTLPTHDSNSSGDAPPATDLVAKQAQHAHAGSRDELFRRVGPAVFAWACLHLRGSLRTQLDPEDVLQEVICRALAALPTWDAARGSFRGFVFGIAKNVLRKGLERAVREPNLRSTSMNAFDASIVDPATTLTRAVARDESLVRAIDRLSALDDADRRLLLHRGLEGLGYEHVAQVLGTSPDAVRKRWQRLCERLREEPRLLELLES